MPFPTSPLSQENVLRDVHDPVNQVLRTNAVLEGGTVEVSLDAADDSIAIGNNTGTNFLAVNSDGSINVNTSGSSTITGTVTSNEAGLTAFQTSQYPIGLSAVQLTPTPLPNRSSVSIRVIAAPNVYVYIGNNNSVTTSSGYALTNGDSLQLDLTPAGQIWAITGTATQTISVLEIA